MPIVTFLVFLAAWFVLIRAVAPGMTADDSAELTLAARWLDVTHPPGYPLLNLAGRLFLVLPVGSPAFRMNLTGAASGAAAVALLHAVARALLRRLGTPSVLAPLLAAGLGLGLPVVFYQATQAEKYAPHLMLAMLAIRAHLGASPYLTALSLGIAFSHHPMALFLLPLLWPVRAAMRRPPEAALMFSLFLLPVSLKVLYPAVRAPALLASPHRSGWGEPRDAAALGRYLTVRSYGSRFREAPGRFVSRLAPQLAAYPSQMTWTALVVAVLGAAAAVRAAPGTALPLLFAGAGSYPLAGGISLPPHLTPQFHLVPQFILLLFAAAALARAPCLLGPVLAATLAVTGWNHATTAPGTLRKDRNFAVWDYNRTLLKLAPPKAVLLAGMDHDLFPLRYLTGVLEERGDVTVLDTPYQTKYRDYRRYLKRAAPEIHPGPYPAGNPELAVRALVRASGLPGCLVFSGYLEAALPGELEFTGPLGFPRSRRPGEAPCPGTVRGRPWEVWRRLSLRALRAPDAGTDRSRPTLGVYGATLSISIVEATAGRRFREAEELLRVKRAVFPRATSTYLELGTLHALRADARAAGAAFERAIAVAPGAVDGYACLALLLDGTKSWEGMGLLLAHARRALPLHPGPELDEAAAALAGGDPEEGARVFRRQLARHALREAEELEPRGIVHARRVHVLRALARRLDPAR